MHRTMRGQERQSNPMAPLPVISPARRKVAGGAYLLDTLKGLFPEGNAQAAGFPAQSPASDKGPTFTDQGGAPADGAADDQTGSAGQNYFDLFGSPLDGMGYGPPPVSDSPADPPLDIGPDTPPDNTAPAPSGWPVGLAEPERPAAPAPQAPVPPSSPDGPPVGVTESEPPAAPAPKAPAAPRSSPGAGWPHLGGAPGGRVCRSQ